MRDVILCIRADEAIHREVNHEFSTLPYDIGIDENQEVIVNSTKS